MQHPDRPLARPDDGQSAGGSEVDHGGDVRCSLGRPGAVGLDPGDADGPGAGAEPDDQRVGVSPAPAPDQGGAPSCRPGQCGEVGMRRLGGPDPGAHGVLQAVLGLEELEGVGGGVLPPAATARPAVGQPGAQGDDRAEQGEEQERRGVQEPGHEHARHGGKGDRHPGQLPSGRWRRRPGEGDLDLRSGNGHPRDRAQAGPTSGRGLECRGGTAGPGDGDGTRPEAQHRPRRPAHRSLVQIPVVEPGPVGRRQVGDGDLPASDVDRGVASGDVGIVEPDGGLATPAEHVPALTERKGATRVGSAHDVQLQGAGAVARRAAGHGPAHPEHRPVRQLGRGERHVVAQPRRARPEPRHLDCRARGTAGAGPARASRPRPQSARRRPPRRR